MMKKLLLSLFAAAMTLGASAYEVGQYVYTSAARYKLTEKVASSDFSNGTEGWTAIAGSATIEEFGSVEEGAGPDGANEFKFSSGAAANGFYLTGTAEPGTYVLTFKAKNADAAFTSVVTAAAQYRVALICNNTGDDVIGTDPVTSASTETVTIGSDWTDCAISVVDTLADNTSVVAILAGLPANTEIADVEVWSVETVYDTRAFGKALNYAELLMADENFNQNADALAALDETYQELKAQYDTADQDGGLDDEAAGSDMLDGLDEAIDNYLEASAGLMNDQFNMRKSSATAYRGNLDFSIYGNVGRNRLTADAADTEGNMRVSGSWMHVGTNAFLESTIQKGQTLTSTITFNQPNFQAGKYFISGEIRAGSITSTSAITAVTPHPGENWSSESEATIFIGKNADGTYINAKVDTLVGSDFKKFYFVGDIPEGSTLSAGVYFAGHGAKAGGTHQIQNVQIRSFGLAEQKAAAERAAAFDVFKTQYEAATSARTKLLSLKDDKDYPYGQNTIDPTVEKWDPYLNAVSTWVDAEGNDTKKATLDELKEWPVLQGVYAAEDTVGFGEQGVDKNTYQYPVVRGYQLVANKIINLRAHFTTLATTIATANNRIVDPRNSVGEIDTFKKAIAAAQSVYDKTLAAAVELTADSAEWKADTTKVLAANATLLAALDVFTASVDAKLKPVVDIDFSKGVEPVYAKDEETGEPTETIEAYQALGNTCENGVASNMVFDAYTTDNTYSYQEGTGIGATYTNSSTNVKTWAGYTLGCNGSNEQVLRVGDGTGTVTLPTLPDTDNGVIDVQFDMYFGLLTGKYAGFNLLDSLGNRVAGFYISKYSAATSYNEFNDANDNGFLPLSWCTGLGSSSVGDNSLYVESNRSTIRLMIDYKNGKVKGMVNNTSGDHEGQWIAINETYAKAPIAKVQVQSNYISATARNCWFDNLKVYEYDAIATVKGDVNGDGTVDIADVNAIIAVICGGEANSAADVNADGSVDIADVNAVIGIICGGE